LPASKHETAAPPGRSFASFGGAISINMQIGHKTSFTGIDSHRRPAA
jgi:hypothetical protein